VLAIFGFFKIIVLMRLIILILLAPISFIQGQYIFTPDFDVKCTTVKSQDRTGTCWSFATTSFLESELIRLGKGELDLSEMYIVRNIYIQKAVNYVLRQGKANFSQGSLAHDQLQAMENYGLIPDIYYFGNKLNDKHDHNEMEKALKGFLDGVIANNSPSPKWLPAFKAILDVYLGEVPDSFEYNRKSYTPESFAEELGLNQQAFIGITSFNHHPYNTSFILEIPDNFSNGSYYNVTLDDLLQITYDALESGFTISWDGDVSEKTFNARKGLAVLPAEADGGEAMESPVQEAKVDAAFRQTAFNNYSTTDDHLMHIVGTARDQHGNRYFKVKNSWGEISDYKGFLYMSEAYFKAKTISIYLNKDAVAPNYLVNR
jgi:bleomycin hydrolase